LCSIELARARAAPKRRTSRRGVRDPGRGARLHHQPAPAGSADARSVSANTSLDRVSTDAASSSARTHPWSQLSRQGGHHLQPQHPPRGRVTRHQPRSNNPTRLAPRLSPTQAFRSRLSLELTPSPVTAAEALLLVGRLLLRAGRLTPEAVGRAKAGRALDGSSMGTNRSAGNR
jgi:hypothetical protein